MSSPDVVVVGAGLAGLAASSLLARRGVDVLLIEEEQDVGGRLRIIQRDGFCLDGGLHCFHYGDKGPIGDLNRELELGISFLESRNASYILQGKNRLPVPAESDTDRADVPGFSEKESARINAWFQRLMEAEAGQWTKKSVADFLEESGFAADELVMRYASSQCLTLLGKSPGGVSAGLLISHSQAVGHPGFHLSVISGGPGRLVEALSAAVSRDNVKVMLGAKVLRIEERDTLASRIVTSSDEFSPRSVIFTGPAQKLPDLLPAQKSLSSLSRRCKKLAPVAGIGLEFGLAARVSEINGVMMDPDEAVIGRFPSNLDPSLAPEGCQISSWLALIEPEDIADVKAAGNHIRRLRRVIARQFPEMEEQVKWERLRVLPVIAGAAPMPAQSADKRPQVAVKQLQNMFLAGDGVGGGGLLSGLAVSSAMAVAKRTMKFLARPDA